MAASPFAISYYWVTPAEGSVKPIAGFTFNKVISPSPFALGARTRE